MRTNYVLIDLESVQPDSLSVLGDDHFKVIVFVGATQAKLPFELAATMQRLGDKAEYIKISGIGPNALDFHIAFYIGQITAHDPSSYFHIVSKDTGFDPLIEHLNAKKIYSSRSLKIEDIPRTGWQQEVIGGTRTNGHGQVSAIAGDQASQAKLARGNHCSFLPEADFRRRSCRCDSFAPIGWFHPH